MFSHPKHIDGRCRNDDPQTHIFRLMPGKSMIIVFLLVNSADRQLDFDQQTHLPNALWSVFVDGLIQDVRLLCADRLRLGPKAESFFNRVKKTRLAIGFGIKPVSIVSRSTQDVIRKQKIDSFKPGQSI